MQEIKELNKLLSKYVDDGFFPGIQWQINIDNDQYSGKYGFNNIETQEKVLDNSLYRIWSMTKPIVAVAALQLIEENKISLDDPITEYLPEFNDLQVMKREDGNIEDVEKITQYPTGPMLNGHHRGEIIGSGTGVWQLDADLNAGKITEDDFVSAEISMSRSKGNCMTMGTASTMGSMVEALGMALPHNAAIPAVDARRYALAHMSGKRIVEMVKENLTMSKVVSKDSFENAIKVNGAIGGSTNAVIHLAAIAGRLEIDLSLDDWEKCGKDIPTLVNLQPSGKYLMEDFYYAGGVPAVIKQLLDKNLLNKDALTVNGKTIEENNFNAECWIM